MKELASSLVKAQKSFAPALKQSQNQHFRSRYVDLAGCIEAVIDALNDNGIFLMQPTRYCDDGVTVETIFVHESGEQLSGGIIHVPASKQDAQGYGSALTYARRYSLMAACGIAPEDDDGNAASKPRAVRQEPEMDLSPKARAVRISEGVKNGDAEGAAGAMSGWDAPLIDAVWPLLDKATQDKLTAHWPKV